MQTILDRAAAYLERMPPAIAGSGGHSATFNASVVLMRGFALPELEALPLLLAWNLTHCQPPWTEGELRHKLRDAARSTRPLGYLLDEAATNFDRTAPDFESAAEKKARQRKAWPQFKPLKAAEIVAIAELRHIVPDAVDLAHRWGFLRGARIEGQDCFVLHEGNFAQARRLDGHPFTLRDGSQVKAKNLPGSEGAFIGRRWLGSAKHVLLVEGVVGMLEALAALILVNMRESWSILAATSARSLFVRDLELVSLLPGRNVRIVPDSDESGYDAAASWLADLEAVGANVDVFELPKGFKDLGDLLISPESHIEALKNLFQ